MLFVNLTPHAIHVLKGEKIVEFPASGKVARLQTLTEPRPEIDGFRVDATRYGDVSDLPEPEDGMVFIVSQMIVAAVRRPDVVAPDTGPTAIRENGQIKAVRGFIRIE